MYVLSGSGWGSPKEGTREIHCPRYKVFKIERKNHNIPQRKIYTCGNENKDSEKQSDAILASVVGETMSDRKLWSCCDGAGSSLIDALEAK
jgi:hypothetical protein